MAGVSYFQRYSQRENHVTNNYLLVLRHLYEASPAKLQQVLRELMGDDKLSLGPSFTQQVRGTHSVPDALINQEAFRLYFETKLGKSLDIGQLRRHIQSIAADSERRGRAILVGLSTTTMPESQIADVAHEAAELGVVFCSVTFAELADAVQAACADHETALRAVVDDFRNFLDEEQLTSNADDRLLIVPCGTSYDENARFGVYYDGADRPARTHCRFLGAYREKMVSMVGEILAVVIAEFREGELTVVEQERGDPTPEMLNRVRSIVEATPYYDLTSRPHRYFILDQFHETRLAKVSKGPVRGAQYIQLSTLLGGRYKPADARQLALDLTGKTFPPNTATS